MPRAERRHGSPERSAKQGRHVERYLSRLAWMLPQDCRDDVVAEAGRHLYDATELEVRRGRSPEEAQRAAVDAFGSALRLALAEWSLRGLSWPEIRSRLAAQRPKGA